MKTSIMPAWSGAVALVASILIAGSAFAEPTITSLSTSSGPTQGVIALTIYGTDFSASGNSATVDGVPCTFIGETTTDIVCRVPEGSGATNPVQVVDSLGVGSNTLNYAYSPPSITSIVPDHGATEGNVPLTINGLNFGASNLDGLRSVTVGTAACPLVASSSDHNVITCTLPPGQGLDRTVEVVMDGQASNTPTFDYDAPDISSVSPTQASAGGGTILTITGSNFGLTASASVDGHDCPLTMQSHTELRCTSPPASAGSGLPVSVSVSGQASEYPIEYVEPACGNHILDTATGEVCDDNNTNSGDGCSADCRIEQTETKDQAGCIVALNKAGAKVFSAKGKDTLTCAKKYVTPCFGVTDSAGFNAALEKVDSAFDKKCGTMPDFGSSLVAVIKGSNRDRSLDVAIDMFGADPDVALAPDALHPNRGRCQDAVLKAELKYASARLKAFGKCKKAGLKDGTILTETALGACLETADNDPALAKPTAQQFSAMIDSCVNISEDLAAAFPGVCAGAPDVALCIEDRVRCRTCQALVESDSLSLDCDDDDDGLDNSSCD